MVCQARGNVADAKAYYEKAILHIQTNPILDSAKQLCAEQISRLNTRIQSLGGSGKCS